MKTKLLLGFVMLFPMFVAAEDLQAGDTGWILVASAFVLFMVLPGLSLFYAGLVRSKNVLSVLMQCFMIVCLSSILWVLIGYSLAFTDGGGINSFVGGLSKLFLNGVGRDSMEGTIPESLFIMFQLTFAAITPALIVGGFAERMRFSAILLFSILWLVVVYFPIAHQVWGGGWLGQLGILDFAGGMVVHLTAGTTALIAAMVIGPRRNFQHPSPPHNMTMTVTGAGILWVGWFGFNGGSALAANGDAAMAILVTQICTAAAALTWMFIEWWRHGKPSVLGIVTGMVAGLVSITPACGFVGPMGALAIGIISSIVCYSALHLIKGVLKIDDSLDVFPVHGVCGALGSVLTGIFVSQALGGVGLDGVTLGQQLMNQIIGTVYVFVYTGVAAYICLKLVGLVTPLRVNEDEENQGIDISQHEESGYRL